jgi:23S rRNA pseudouridine2604 synthase
MTDSAQSVRLAKRVAETLNCSRAQAEQYIEGGWVQVDGEVIEEPGAKVTLAQQIALLPKATLDAPQAVTILLHKPAGLPAEATPGNKSALQCVTQANLWGNERAGVRFLKRHVTGLTLCGSLETEASGLMVWSQDWHVARKLVDDAAKIEHEYVVEVQGEMIPNGLALLNHGLPWNGRPLPPIKVSWQNESRLRFAIKGVQIGQIAHMCALVGLRVVSMRRIRVGRIPMTSLPVGQWRYLLGYERF